MGWLIGTIIFITLLFSYLIGSYIYKKMHHLPTGECGCCKAKMQKAIKKGMRDYHKEKCCCK